jgi:hypothetical protein
MGADNLLEATIVAPNGDILTINPCQHSDLFFAVRGGGGGTFGVITSAVIRTFPSPQVTSNLLAISYKGNNTREYWDMIAYLHAELPRLKEGGDSGYYFQGYDSGLLGTSPSGSPSLAYLGLFSVYNKPNGTIEKLHAPIEDYLAKRRHLFTYLSNYTSVPNYHLFAQSFKNEDVATGGGAYGSRLMSAESLSDAKRTADVFSQVGPSGDPTGKLRTGVVSDSMLLGHFAAPSAEPPPYYRDHISMNPAWRNTVTHLITAQPWRDGMPQSVVQAVYRDVTHNRTQLLRDLSPGTGAYFNEADSFEPEWQTSFFGVHYPRLFDIKRRYDPDGLLWCRRCVGSEMWVEQRDGRLCRAEKKGGYGDGYRKG